MFNINLKTTGAHANNYLVQNVSRALVDKFTVKFAATTVQDTDSYDIYKTFEDLFLYKRMSGKTCCARAFRVMI